MKIIPFGSIGERLGHGISLQQMVTEVASYRVRGIMVMVVGREELLFSSNT